MNLFQYMTILIVLNFLSLVGMFLWVKHKLKALEVLGITTSFQLFRLFKHFKIPDKVEDEDFLI